MKFITIDFNIILLFYASDEAIADSLTSDVTRIHVARSRLETASLYF